MKPTPQMLNDAVCAYMQTCRTRERLMEHLSQNGLEDSSQEIIAAMDALSGTAEDYLWDFPGGIPWTEEFKKDYRAHLQQEHPWLDDRAAAGVFSFSGWLCWHEGLNASYNHTSNDPRPPIPRSQPAPH